MARYLTLSRAARLVGVSRGVLQKKIRSGGLSTFEGEVEIDELLRAYPDTRMEDNTMLERVERIMENALTKIVREGAAPLDAGTLAARVGSLSGELAQSRADADSYETLINDLQAFLKDLAQRPDAGAGAQQVQAWLTAALAARQTPLPRPLMARDAFLRVMVANVKLSPSGHDFFVDGADSLLEAALHGGRALDYGCSDGSCGRCRARVVSGRTRQLWPQSYPLSKAEQAAGEVLMCCHTAVTDLVLEAVEAVEPTDIPPQSFEARIQSIEHSSAPMCILHLRTPRSHRLRFMAGQHVSLAMAGLPAERHPVASCPCDDRHLEFHLPLNAGSALAQHVAEAAGEGDTVALQGPMGEATLPEDMHGPLVFVAWDNGFAPVKGLIEHALALDLAESIHLYWVQSAAMPSSLENRCRAWADALDPFHYHPMALSAAQRTRLAEDSTGLMEAVLGEVKDRLAADGDELEDVQLYLAGPAALTELAQRWLPRQGLEAVRLRVNTVPGRTGQGNA